MYQSKKEVRRKFETLQRRCKTMVSGTPGDIQSIVCENDIECKQYKRKV